MAPLSIRNTNHCSLEQQLLLILNMSSSYIYIDSRRLINPIVPEKRDANMR